MKTSEPKRFVSVLPELAAELQRMLAERGESKLAEQVQELNLIERCRCGDDFCATFYVLPKPVGAYGLGHRNVALTPREGILILDVLADKIAAVEVLYRNEVREKLLVEFP